jgi:methyl-accepting chemotaxis protein
MDDKLTFVLIAITAAVVLQMLILAGMFFTVRKLSLHLKSVADEVKTQALPLLEGTNTLQADVKRIVETSAPKFELLLDNAAAISTTAHAGIGRMESTVNDLLDRARLQIIRADEMVTRAMDSVEDTTDKVAHSVTSPIKHASGIMQGISTGLGTYFSQKRPRNTGPSDEMFI